MPQVAERPAPFSDPEVARQAGLRSAELRHQNEAELTKLRLILADKPIEPAEPTKPVNAEVNRQIDLTNELVTHARAELKRLQDDDYGFCEECKRHGADAKEQAALLRELRGLMEHLCRLHNIAQAPTSKALQPARQQRRAIPEPVAIPPVQSDSPVQ